MRGSKVDITDEQILEDYKITRNIKKTAKNLGVCYTTAYTRLDSMNEIMRKKRIDIKSLITPEFIEFASSHSISQIAKEYGLDNRQTRMLLNKYDIKFIKSKNTLKKYKIEDVEARKYILNELLKLYSLDEIARVLCVTPQRVSQLLNEGL